MNDYSVSYSIPKLKTNDNLKSSIQHLVSYLESNNTLSHAISILSQRFGIKRRRLYDIINVLMSVGCCQKSCLDQIIWYGKNKIIETIEKLKEVRNVEDSSISLGNMFPVNNCIGISNLTISFITLFFALKTNHLDLRFIAQFFSRQTTRYKTTLCKLYQICFILGAVGVTTRTSQVCEVVLNEPYYDTNLCNIDTVEEENDPLSISKLLNRPIAGVGAAHIMIRRKEFNDNFIESVSSTMSRVTEDAYLED